MTTVVVILLVLLAVVGTTELRTLTGIDTERRKYYESVTITYTTFLVNTILDGAKAKFSSSEYSYLDDLSPGDYFDNITSSTKILMEIVNEVTLTAQQSYRLGSRNSKH